MTSVAAWIRDYLSTLLGMPAERISLDCGVNAYGLDSVDAVLMAGELEEAFGVSIDSGTFLQHETIAAAVAWFERELARQRAQGRS
jgi:acyl carrier protein